MFSTESEITVHRHRKPAHMNCYDLPSILEYISGVCDIISKTDGCKDRCLENYIKSLPSVNIADVDQASSTVDLNEQVEPVAAMQS